MFYIVWTCQSERDIIHISLFGLHVSGSEGATFYMLSLSMAPLFGSLCDMSLGPCVEYLALVSSIFLLCSSSKLCPMFSMGEQMLLFPLVDLLPRSTFRSTEMILVFFFFNFS